MRLTAVREAKADLWEVLNEVQRDWETQRTPTTLRRTTPGSTWPIAIFGLPYRAPGGA